MATGQLCRHAGRDTRPGQRSSSARRGVGVDVQHGALGQAAKSLVGGLDREVCAALHRRGGEGGVESEVGAMGFVDY